MKELLSIKNPIFAPIIENLDEVLKESTLDLVNGKYVKAKVTLDLTLSCKTQENSEAQNPNVKFKISVNSTDDTEPANSERKVANIYKEHIKGETLHKALEFIVDEDAVYTDELKTPLEKIAEGSKEESTNDEG